MADPDQPSTSAPAELCGYMVDAALAADKSYLAIGPGGRGVVLKKLESDCLVRGILHPIIRDRLSRVRELAHAGVANLHGVGREGQEAYLIWEYADGASFNEYVVAEARTPQEIQLLAREIILTVDSLHSQGIVHGAIHGGNVIVSAGGSVRLTHISPLLYEDPAGDMNAVLDLLAGALERRHEENSPLAQLLNAADRPDMTLRVLGAQVAALIESRDAEPAPAAFDQVDRTLRRRALLGALAVAVAGLAIGFGLWRMIDGGHMSLHALWHHSRGAPAQNAE